MRYFFLVPTLLFIASACTANLELDSQNTNNNGTTESTTTTLSQNNGDVLSNCGVDELVCDGTCTDTRSNSEHCGECGQGCPAGNCQNFVCQAAANNGNTNNANNTTYQETCEFEMCGTMCVNVQSNPAHCGACDSPCSGGQVCQNNACVILTEVEGILAATNIARSTGVDCGQYGEKPSTTPLTLDPELNKAAQAHAQDMADNNFFAHVGSDGSSFGQRVGRTNFRGQPIGENIAGGGSEPAGIVDRWIASDGHCRNLMNPQATKLGVGFTVGGQYGTLWVQVFAR